MDKQLDDLIAMREASRYYKPVAKLSGREVIHVPKGKCNKCGKLYYGWALKYRPDGSLCKCGGKIELIEDK